MQSGDPLEHAVQSRATLFDGTFGDIGLAASIFRVLGLPTKGILQRLGPDAGKISFDVEDPTGLASRLPDLTMEVEWRVLIEGLVVVDPLLRMKAGNILAHKVFEGEVLMPYPRADAGAAQKWRSEGYDDLVRPYLDTARRRYTRLFDEV